jgi:redox-sensitive bicupin YhaK (pirin superfamily)
MIYIRKSDERGRGKNDWLDSYYTFSFANYYDPGFMGFGSLRVINEDFIQPSKGFGEHSHEDMEIMTYVIKGELAHRDSMGNGSIIRPGEIQRMTAGSGVKHSEYNHSNSDVLHLLQIWILPNEDRLTPSYQQSKIERKNNELILLASSDNRGIVTIHQDAFVYAGYYTHNHMLHYPLQYKRGVWLQMIRGDLKFGDEYITAGDGVAIFDENDLTLTSLNESEFLLFDLKIVD